MKYKKVYSINFSFTEDHISNSSMYVEGKLLASGVDINVKNLNSRSDFSIQKDKYNWAMAIERRPYNALNPFDTVEITGKDLKNKSIFRFPKITLPRTKTDLLKEKYNISVKRSPIDVDYKVISNNILGSISTASWASVYRIEKFKSYIDKVNTDEECKKKLTDFYNYLLNEKANAVDDQYDVLIHVSKTHAWSGFGNVGKFDHFIKQFDSFIKNSEAACEIEIINNNELFKELLKSDNLILDSDLVKISNEDSATLDEESYGNLSKMISSNDRENVTLALEVMSNCNIEDSYDKVALLFFFYTYELKTGKNWNSVNVKSLRKTFDKYSINHGNWNGRTHGYQRFIKLLAEDDQFTEFSFKLISKEIFEKCINNVCGFNNKSFLKLDISAIQLNDEYKDKLKAEPLDVQFF